MVHDVRKYLYSYYNTTAQSHKLNGTNNLAKIPYNGDLFDPK